ARVVLGALEVRQHVLVTPAHRGFVAHPFVIVGRMPSRVDLRVDRRAAADHLGLREAQDPALQVLLWDRVPAPGGDALGHFGEAGWHMKQRVRVTATGLQQQHLDRGIGAQAMCEYAARRAPADHDVVVFLHCSAFARKWWPTRSACAAMVSAGLTAAEDGKNPASTTYKLSWSQALHQGSSAERAGSSPKRTVPH